jgi:glutaredoxin 3
MSITIYTKPTCPYCAAAKALLHDKQATFTEIDISTQPDRREEMMSRSGRHTVPQIFIGTTHVGGYDDLAALDAAGKLDPMLQTIRN